MPLTDTAIRNANPREKAYRINEFGGLSLEVRTTDKKCWRFRGTYNGKEILLSLGVYPAVTLAAARDRCKECQEQLAHGVNPSAKRKEEKAAQTAVLTFEALALEWHARTKAKWSEGHATRILYRLRREIFPFIGSLPANDIPPKKILEVLRIMENRGATDLAHRMHQAVGQVLRYGVATGRVDRDSSADLRGALTPVSRRHNPCPKDHRGIAALMRAIYDYQGSHVIRCALRLTPLVFVRPGELRHAKWADIDTTTAEWRYFVTKTKTQHIVPLSRQAIEVLEELRPLTGSEAYVFPGRRSEPRPMSENTINAALRTMGFSRDEITAHGFRGMASTALNEMGWHHDAIERQLAHKESNSVRAAYNHADYLQERRRMMQAWADYLDQLREGAKIIPLHHVVSNDA